MLNVWCSVCCLYDTSMPCGHEPVVCVVYVLFLLPCATATLQADGQSTAMQASVDTRMTSFDWHPKHDNRLIVIANNGALADLFIAERRAIVRIQQFTF